MLKFICVLYVNPCQVDLGDFTPSLSQNRT